MDLTLQQLEAVRIGQAVHVNLDGAEVVVLRADVYAAQPSAEADATEFDAPLPTAHLVFPQGALVRADSSPREPPDPARPLVEKDVTTYLLIFVLIFGLVVTFTCFAALLAGNSRGRTTALVSPSRVNADVRRTTTRPSVLDTSGKKDEKKPADVKDMKGENKPPEGKSAKKLDEVEELSEARKKLAGQLDFRWLFWLFPACVAVIVVLLFVVLRR